MRRRVEDTLDLLGLHELRDRSLRTLSGGQQQRVAIGAVLTASSARARARRADLGARPRRGRGGARRLARLVHDVGLTVVVAEHRLERVLPFADRVILVPGGGAPIVVGPPDEIMRDGPGRTPTRGAGRLRAGSRSPSTVRDARRLATPLRERLAPRAAPSAPRAAGRWATPSPSLRRARVPSGRSRRSTRSTSRSGGEVDRADGPQRLGEVDAARASSPAPAARARGTVRVGGEDPAGLRRASSCAPSASSPRTPSCSCTARASGTSAGPRTARTASCRGRPPASSTGCCRACRGTTTRGTCPRASASRSRWRSSRPDAPLLLLDEPTRGLDYPSKARLEASCASSPPGHAVVVATHDVELVARVADRAVLLADGEVVADGRARGRVPLPGLRAPGRQGPRPGEWLTVDEVADALAAKPVGGPGAHGARRRRRRGARRPAAAGASVLLAAASSASSRSAGRSWCTRTRARTSPTPATRRGSSWRSYRCCSPSCWARSPRVARRQGGRAARHPGRLRCRAARAEPRRRGLRAGVLPAHPVGRVFGRGFGFVLGALTIFASSLITGGVGPWLPFQMLGAAWMGFGAGCLPRAAGRPSSCSWRATPRSALAYGAPPQPVVLALSARTRRLLVRARCGVRQNLHRFVFSTSRPRWASTSRGRSRTPC